MHEVQTILIDVCGVCVSVGLSVCLVMWLNSAAAHAVYAACLWCLCVSMSVRLSVTR